MPLQEHFRAELLARAAATLPEETQLGPWEAAAVGKVARRAVAGARDLVTAAALGATVVHVVRSMD